MQDSETKGLPGLRAAREARGLSQEALARRANVQLRALQRWERGESSPSIWGAVDLANALGMRVEKLASGQPLSDFPGLEVALSLDSKDIKRGELAEIRRYLEGLTDPPSKRFMVRCITDLGAMDARDQDSLAGEVMRLPHVRGFIWGG